MTQNTIIHYMYSINKEKYNKNNKIKMVSNNKGNKIITKNKNRSRSLFITIKLIILMSLLNQMISKNKNPLIESLFSNITLKINVTGLQKIFCSNNSIFKSQFYPNKVLINGNKQNIVNHSYYFNHSNNSIELFWNKTINNCGYMFFQCSNIIEIDFANFNTSQVTRMNQMFYGCKSLISLDLSSFNTSKLETTKSMFYNCILLTSLNLSNFNTSNLKGMKSMFYYCKSLKTLNLSTFDISKVTEISYLFCGCSSLTSLNLSNFYFSKASNIKYMFKGCKNLEYINLKNYNESNSSEVYNDIFDDVPNNLVICININNKIDKLLSILKTKKCFAINCSDDWKSKQKKLSNKDPNECFDDCRNSSTYKYEYMDECYSNCSNGYLNDYQCKCELEKCLTCSKESLKKELCIKCNDNYYPMENAPLNLNNYFDCYNEPKGYYLGKIESVHKKCYNTCESCEIKGDRQNHNCLSCNNKFTFEIKNDKYFNCYEKCSNYYYFDNDNYFHCTLNLSCPNEYPLLIAEKKECIAGDLTYIENVIEIMIENILIFEKNETLDENGKEEEIKIYNNILETVESVFTSNNYNLTNIDKGEEQIINTGKMTITFTTTENQKNNINSSMITIDLGECEKMLRNHYNLSNNQTVYMKKLDIIQKGLKTNKTEYDVYGKLSGNNLEKLNLTVCAKTKIYINIPININDNIDKLNTSSAYFNDICYVTETNDGIDISLYDRKNNYIEGDYIICQEDCSLSEYDPDIKKAKCECQPKESSSSFADMNINKDKLFENLKDITNLVNFNILKCYKKLFSISGIFYNIGSIIIISIIILHIILFFILNLSQINKISKYIKDIILGKLNINSKKRKTNNQMKIKKNIIKEPIVMYVFKLILNNNKNKNKSIIPENKPYQNENYQNKFALNKNIFNYNIKRIRNIKRNNNYKSKESFLNSKHIEQKEIKNIMNYNNDELNELSYTLALIYDKRTYCQYYISLLKSKHSLIFSFCKNDYNSKIIKIDLFFVEFAILYTINALFFNDETMHKIYINKGSFDLETQIPLTIYSSLITMILDSPLEFLALSNDSIISFKQNKTMKNVRKIGKKLYNCFILKFVFYFIFSFIFLLFFWYYISMFGVIYKNTQYHLLKDTLLSFGLSLLYPLGIYLLPGFFRIPSLSHSKQNRRWLYNFSKLLQFF